MVVRGRTFSSHRAFLLRGLSFFCNPVLNVRGLGADGHYTICTKRPGMIRFDRGGFRASLWFWVVTSPVRFTLYVSH